MTVSSEFALLYFTETQNQPDTTDFVSFSNWHQVGSQFSWFMQRGIYIGNSTFFSFDDIPSLEEAGMIVNLISVWEEACARTGRMRSYLGLRYLFW